MKKRKKDILAWAKKNLGEKRMQEITEIAIKGLEFELEFLKNPCAFCAAHQFMVYMGLGPSPSRGTTYVFIHQKNIDSFAVVWLYPDGYAPAYVVETRALQNLINMYDFSFIDNEIFLFWLQEHEAIFQKTYQSCKEKLDEIAALKEKYKQ